MTRIALVSTSDTDLLSARASGADYVYVNPSKAAHAEMAEAFAAADLIVARILGSPKSLCTGFARIRGEGQPMVVLGGEQAPDASLMELSTVPIGRRRRGPRLPGPGRPGEPAPAARLPVRHRAAHRRGVRASGRAAGLGCPSTGSGRVRPGSGPSAARRHPLLPRPVHRREHRVRRGAGRRGRCGRAVSASPSTPPRCGTRRPTCWTTSAPWTRWSPLCSPPAAPARPPRAPGRTTRGGTYAPSRRWTSRSCKASA